MEEEHVLECLKGERTIRIWGLSSCRDIVVFGWFRNLGNSILMGLNVNKDNMDD